MAPFQNLPISICSGVAAEPASEPRICTSFNDLAYTAELSAGGGPGLNCAAFGSKNGVTPLQFTNRGCFGKLGGVDWYAPGPVPNMYGSGGVFDPSFARSRKMRSPLRRPAEM